MAPPVSARVLVVDDEENLRLVLSTFLKRHGYEVQAVASAERALTALEGFEPTYVITDVRMPGMSGLDLTKLLAQRSPDVVVIVMSAYGSIDLAIEALKAGAYDYVAKPFKQDEILLTLRKAEERESLRRENQLLRARVGQEKLGGIIGQSEPMQALFRIVERAADVATTVLVTGESGSGKELVARALHDRGRRASGPFVAVNCGAIPATLLESELFGHKRGAFTDATTDRAGLFEQADGGTLFLDEIGELPLELQPKLLRVLQESTLRRLGDAKDRKVDVRVVAATARVLEEEVDEGRFREDLFYRLNVIPVSVPPLRERRGDIPILVEHFMAKHNERLRTHVSSVTPEAMRRLVGHRWPGNVRELENMLERMMVLADGEALGEADLPPQLRDGVLEPTIDEGDLSVKRATRILEETLIRRALVKTAGNRTAAAKLLELSHRALLYKLKDYGIR